LLVGINVFMVLSSVLSASFLERTQVLGRQGPVLGAAGLVVLTLVLAELVPKRIAQADPVGTAIRLSGLVRISSFAFSPIATILGAVPQWVAGRLVARTPDDLDVTPESLSEMARLGEEQGGIEPETGGIIEGILSSGDTPVVDLMVPFDAVVVARADSSLSSLADLARKTGFSRFPVVRISNGPVAGMVHVKDVAARLFAGQSGTVELILRPVLRTSPDAKASDLLAEMRSRRLHLAVVERPPSVPIGIVTIEDLLSDIL
jgi:CBS domain containing-hemolysin-like protein